MAAQDLNTSDSGEDDLSRLIALIVVRVALNQNLDHDPHFIPHRSECVYH
jgi:hypothetical protein